jgi:hypothetical protein
VLGGWAVYKIVNESFQRNTGRNYLGSRDIDLGFHLDANASVSELKKSNFAAAVSALESNGFESVGFRLVKHFDVDSHQELTPEQAKQKPSYDLFELYVDPIVDIIPSNAQAAFGFVPIDEPLLSFVFQNAGGQRTQIFGKDVILPLPYLMLATKFHSLPHRDKEHKMIKDLADIYALAWHSPTTLDNLKRQIEAIVSREERKKVLMKIKQEHVNLASQATGVESVEIRRVLSELQN